MKIDPSLFNDKDVENSGPEHNIPPIVLIAIVLFSLIFLGGGLYLLFSGPFIGIDNIEPIELPPVTVAVKNYSGPLWLIEKERKKVRSILVDQGLVMGSAINIFKKSAARMRPLKVDAEIGYVLGLGMQPKDQIDQLVIKQIQPGRRLVVHVDGTGNFSGSKAYKAAEKVLRPKGLGPAEGERFEIKKQDNGKTKQIEHWIPVN